jgi:hypothetical protein
VRALWTKRTGSEERTNGCNVASDVGVEFGMSKAHDVRGKLVTRVEDGSSLCIHLFVG